MSSVRARAIHNTFYKRNKKLVPRALLSNKGTWEFLRTLEKCEKYSPSARDCPHLSRVLKNFRVLIELNDALGAFFISLMKHATMSQSESLLAWFK